MVINKLQFIVVVIKSVIFYVTGLFKLEDMKREIVEVPNPILRMKSEPVREINREVLRLVEDMKDTLKIQSDPGGAGLSAPQIGVNLRVAVVSKDVEQQNTSGAENVGSKESVMVLINPVILDASERKQHIMEGCLSVPGKWGLVPRARKIKIETLTPEGKRVKFRAKGLLACVIQHEIDHLDGILFMDKVEGGLEES